MNFGGSANDASTGQEDPYDRPTLPIPTPLPVRVELVKIAYGFVSLEIVVPDLSRDPRNELCYERALD